MLYLNIIVGNSKHQPLTSLFGRRDNGTLEAGGIIRGALFAVRTGGSMITFNAVWSSRRRRSKGREVYVYATDSGLSQTNSPCTAPCTCSDACQQLLLIFDATLSPMQQCPRCSLHSQVKVLGLFPVISIGMHLESATSQRSAVITPRPKTPKLGSVEFQVLNMHVWTGPVSRSDHEKC